jgi:High potential iron-sulfur protein
MGTMRANVVMTLALPRESCMMRTEMSRKDFLRVVFLGLVAGAGGSLLASCGKKEEAAQGTTPPARTQSAAKPAAQSPCADVSGLTDAELTMRNVTLQYVTESPDPEKRCDNCKFWTPPAAADQVCGTCTLVKGPISPKGHCTSWFTRET